MTQLSNYDLAEHDEHDEPLRYVDSIPTDPDFTVHVADNDREPVKSSRFNADNAEAVPVFERATTSFIAGSMAIGATPFPLLGRHRGRKSVALSAPVTITVAGTATTPKGFQWSHDRSMIDAGVGFQLNPGDSAQIDSEAEIWVGPLPGNTTGFVQYLETFNTLGGPADS
jgi:hypothetical protein